MALLKNVEKRIWDIEGFQVIFRHLDGRDIRGDMKDVPMYLYERAAKNNYSIARWIQERIKLNYPFCNVEVLRGDGRIAQGKTRLSTVRDTYLEE